MVLASNLLVFGVQFTKLSHPEDAGGFKGGY